MSWIDVQMDRVVGPTHHFGGLGVGNIASQIHRGQASNPAAAALQGLDKMQLVASTGMPQLILPPQKRPQIRFLRSLGFQGTDSDVLTNAIEQAPHLLSAAMSCSAMWTANAATVTPACDSSNATTCLTVANLNASLHRAIEPEETLEDLRQTLPDSFQFFPPLPGGAALRDEGAANHMRLASQSGQGIHLFVYGDRDPRPAHYWPRQTLAASQCVARLHGLDPAITFFLKQSPIAIDAGAFHNDVVAMSDRDLLIHHELAYDQSDETLAAVASRYFDRTGNQLTRISVEQSSLSIEEAVDTYLFNSQILSVPWEGGCERIVLCPVQVERNVRAHRLVQQWRSSGLFSQVHFVDLGQSMDGGGGPACLRLRIPMRDNELHQLPGNRRWSEQLDSELREAIRQNYPTRVTLDDLGSSDFLEQANHATDCIIRILSPR